jgi:hypothetical protein
MHQPIHVLLRPQTQSIKEVIFCLHLHYNGKETVENENGLVIFLVKYCSIRKYIITYRQVNPTITWKFRLFCITVSESFMNLFVLSSIHQVYNGLFSRLRQTSFHNDCNWIEVNVVTICFFEIL